MDPHKYTSLESGEIRLLVLSPRGEPELTAKIETVNLNNDHEIQYEALSYAWGTVQKRELVFIAPSSTKEDPPKCGHGGGAIGKRTSLRITQNLALALRHIQHDEKSRVLWIDAICINQANDDEKSSQVQKMADIYKRSSRVLVWLGPGLEDTEVAVATLDHLASQAEVDFLSGSAKVAENGDPRWTDRQWHFPYDSKLWRSLTLFFQSSWFRRLWVWQEVRANPIKAVVMCGHNYMPWLSLRKAIVVLHNNRRYGSVHFSRLLSPAYRLSCDFESMTMDNLLLETTRSECEDPRDRIFALLGMLPNRHRLGIVPDYSQSVSDLYKIGVLNYYALYKSLGILKFCEIGKPSLGLHSWVPDWSKKKSGPLTHQLRNVENRASLTAQAEAEYDGLSSLKVTGIEVGVVSTIRGLDIFSKKQENPHFYAAMFSLLPPSWLQDLTAEDVALESLIRTLCRNVFDSIANYAKSEEPTYEDVKNTLLWWKDEYAKGYNGNQDPEESIYGISDLHPFERHFRSSVRFAVSEQVLLKTSGDLYALGRENTKLGDRICTVLGCHAPLLMRPLPNDKWQVVGQCYAYGIANGEALLGALPNNFRAVDSGDLTWPAYLNLQTGREQIEDPRLFKVPLPQGWEIMEESSQGYPVEFRNAITGRRTWRDPRHSADSLRARGVAVRSFELV